MSHARIVVNDEVLLEDDLEQWITRTPKFIEDIIEKMQPNSAQKPEPHMLALMTAFAGAVANQVDIAIHVTTAPGCWTLTVKEN